MRWFKDEYVGRGEEKGYGDGERTRSFATIRELAPRHLDNPLLLWDIARLAIDGAVQSNVEQNKKLDIQKEKTLRREEWTCGRLRMALNVCQLA